MSVLRRWVTHPSDGVREAYMGLGGLLLILGIIALAGASFTFDDARRALLRPTGFSLIGLGALCWLRGSVPARQAPQNPES